MSLTRTMRKIRQELVSALREIKAEVSSARLRAEDLQVREQLPELILRLAKNGQKDRLSKLLRLAEIDITALTNIPPSRFTKFEKDSEVLIEDSISVLSDVEEVTNTNIVLEDEYLGQKVTKLLRLELLL